MLHFAKQAIYAFIKFVTFVESELWGRGGGESKITVYWNFNAG